MVRNTAREIAIHLSYELSFTEKSIEYVGEDEETGRKEYSIKNDELGIDTTLYTEDWGGAVNVYDKEGARVHIYNPDSSNE